MCEITHNKKNCEQLLKYILKSKLKENKMSVLFFLYVSLCKSNTYLAKIRKTHTEHSTHPSASVTLEFDQGCNLKTK